MESVMRSPKFETAKILTIGDAMIDRYWHGVAKRISAEAPIPDGIFAEGTQASVTRADYVPTVWQRHVRLITCVLVVIYVISATSQSATLAN